VRSRRMGRSLWSAGGTTAISFASSSRPRMATGFTRDAMRQMEEDLGTRLDWVAVDHFNTGHPHSHGCRNSEASNTDRGSF
jgi:type IV secretory pathway VirD2 relaxase